MSDVKVKCSHSGSGGFWVLMFLILYLASTNGCVDPIYLHWNYDGTQHYLGLGTKEK